MVIFGKTKILENDTDSGTGLKTRLTRERGVEWSNGQRRSLLLQGSRDRIPVFPLIFQSPTMPYDASRPVQRRAARDVKTRERRE